VVTESFGKHQTLKNRLLTVEAERWLGMMEEGGNNMGQLVRLFQSQIGIAHGEPWCMSFVQYCCYWVDRYVSSQATHSLHKSEHCMTVWRKTPQSCRLHRPEVGSVAIWNKLGTDAGHTGVVIGVGEGNITTIEGNTGDDARRVIREGDGVFAKSFRNHFLIFPISAGDKQV